MKIISHRGNIDGKNEFYENHPLYIDAAIQSGFDVEIDIRFFNQKIWLGHDFPQYEIDFKWIKKRKLNLLLHCKNLESLYYLSCLTFSKDISYFCHKDDPYTIISNGLIWVHDLNQKTNKKCIIPLIEKNELEMYSQQELYGICTDYPLLFKKIFNL